MDLSEASAREDLPADLVAPTPPRGPTATRAASAAELAPLLEVARTVLTRDPRARSPLVLFDREALTAQVELWRKHLGEVEPHFAVKTCNAPAVLAHFHALGLSFDAATAGELQLLERLGVPGERVICTHPIRDAEDLAAIAHYRPRALVVENVAELRKLQLAGIPARDYAPELFVRLELPFGGLSGKFGVEVAHLEKDPDGTLHWRFVTTPARRLFEEARAIERESGFRYGAFGLSSHVGTNTTKVDKYQILLRVLAHVRFRLAARGIDVPLCNLGGGYPDTEKPKEEGTTQEAFLAELGAIVRAEAVRERGVRFLAEPGRFLVSNAGAVVVGVMHVDERRLLPQADGSYLTVPHLKVQMNDGLYGNLLGERHDEKHWQFAPLRTEGEGTFAREALPAILNGKTCDSWDRLARLRPLPRDLRAGDHLLVPHAGAYTIVTATDFNSAPRAQVGFYWRTEKGEVIWRLYDASGTPLTDAPARERAPDLAELRPRATPGLDLADSQHVSLTRLVGSVAGKVDGGLLRPKALRGDEPLWQEALALVYRNELTLRLEEVQPLAEEPAEWQLEVRREGRQEHALLRIGKHPLEHAEAEQVRSAAPGIVALSSEPRLAAIEELGNLPEGGHPYCLQELVEGQALPDRLFGLQAAQGKRRVDWRREGHRTCLEHLRQAALVLELAHARGLVHGGVRPANLVVPILPQGPVRLTGWALRRTGDEALEMRSPECAPGKALAPSDDVWGLAGTLHFLLWGHSPRGERALRATSNVPPELVSIVRRGIALAPEERYSSAGELAEELRRFLEREPVQAHREALSGATRLAYTALRAFRRRSRRPGESGGLGEARRSGGGSR